MIVIIHRVNSIKKLKKIKYKFGVEIDIRSEKNKLYLSHDAFKLGTNFEKWLKYYKHKFIVLNVKEEGLETKILKALKKYKINKFFFHDQTFSSMLKIMKKTKVSIRISEYEEIKNKRRLFKYIKWVWIDHFTKFPLNIKQLKQIKKFNIKFCIVSPELVKRRYKKKILKLKKYLHKNNFHIDAVCTKYPSLWSRQN